MKYNDILVKEHDFILILLDIIKKECRSMFDTKKCNVTRIEEIIYLVKHYADDYHHGKEEKFLFNIMEEELGNIGKKMISHGMLVEHDLGRLYMQTIRTALVRYAEGNTDAIINIIANLTCYCDLLIRHINKENEVIYTYALRKLSKETLEKVEDMMLTYEEEHTILRQELIQRLLAL